MSDEIIMESEDEPEGNVQGVSHPDSIDEATGNPKSDVAIENLNKNGLASDILQITIQEDPDAGDPDFSIPLCMICDKIMATRNCLQRHLRNIHKLEPKLRDSICCTEEDCKFTCNFVKVLHSHLEEKHGIIMQKQQLSFRSMQEFYSWKENMERKTKSHFRMNSGPKVLSDGTTKFYFLCHRSGIYKARGQGIRKLQKRGTCKTGFTCPACIQAEDRGSVVRVLYNGTHHGHDMDLTALPLLESDRKAIGRMISDGMSFDQILSDIRQNISIDENIQRLNLLTRKDLWNIKRDLSNINVDSLCFDSTSTVATWVEMVNRYSDMSPIIFFKDRGISASLLLEADFILCLMTPFQTDMLRQFGNDRLCIHSTRVTNGYNFQLTTIIIGDDYGSDIPVAHCISNRVDTEPLVTFFLSIKRCTGNITPRIFMVNDSPAFYNAWENVMGVPGSHLVLAWTVERNWKINLKTVPEEKRDTLYHSLQDLLEESSLDKFSYLLELISKDLMKDPDTKRFGKYFIATYSNRPQDWSCCYRINLGIDINMFVESCMKVLECLKVENEKIQQLCNPIFSLLILSRDSLHDRLAHVNQGDSSQRISTIYDRHNESLTVLTSDIIPESKTKWLVKFHTNHGTEYYHVNSSLVDPQCKEFDCPLKCIVCNICIHKLTCTCLDYLVEGNMCKHIHAVCCFMERHETRTKMKTEPVTKCSNSVSSVNDDLHSLSPTSQYEDAMVYETEEKNGDVPKEFVTFCELYKSNYKLLSRAERVKVNRGLINVSRILATKRNISKQSRKCEFLPLHSKTSRTQHKSSVKNTLNDGEVLYNNFDHTYLM